MPDMQTQKVCHICGADAPLTTCKECHEVTCTQHMVFDICTECDEEDQHDEVDVFGDETEDEDSLDAEDGEDEVETKPPLDDEYFADPDD